MAARAPMHTDARADANAANRRAAMTELQSALQQIVGWLEDGSTLDQFAAYLAELAGECNKPDPVTGAREANRIFELLREAAEFDF